MVQAVRGAEALMLRLIRQSAQAMEPSRLAGEGAARLEQDTARQLLHLHRPAMLKGYGLALLETFGQPGGAVVRHLDPSALTAPVELLPGAGTRLGRGGDFASLALVDDAALQAQLAHHRLLQSVAPQVEIALAELDALVSAVQGLDCVQPERNPLRPQNYVRALQRVIDDTGVDAAHAACWSGAMGEHLGALLVSEYSRSAQFLREQGVEPAAYGLAQPAREAGVPPSGWGRRQFDADVHASRWRAPSRYGDAMSQSRAYGDYEQQAQQEDLTLRLVAALLSDLRWIDAGGEGEGAGSSHPASLASPLHAPAWQGGEPVSLAMPAVPAVLPEGWTSPSCMALESVQDAQLEQLVQALQAPDDEGMALLTLQRMMRYMAADARLLPSVRRTVHLLEPMLQQLVLRDARFFADRSHPARQLLDELTARSLWFSSESAPGLRHFLQVADQAVVWLAAEPQLDASAFGRVLQQLREGWTVAPADAPCASGPPAQEPALAAALSMSAVLYEAGSRDRGPREARTPQDMSWPESAQPKAGQIAAAIRRLPSAQGVPDDILDFATGPWAEVIASAHGMPGAAKDPGGYLALVPSLLWSVSSHASSDTARLVALAPRLQARLRAGLRGAGRTEEEIQAFAARLAGLHQDALDAGVSGVPAGPPQPPDSTQPAEDQAPPSGLPPSGMPPSGSEDSALRGLAPSLSPATRVPSSLFGKVAAASPPPASTPVPPSAPAPASTPASTPASMPASMPAGAHGPAAAAAAVPDAAASGAAASGAAASGAAASGAATQAEDWPLGMWAELSNARQSLRTQLTWVSPQQTLFLFTAPDGSTQSMTRRMRDKLLAQGQLKRL